MFKIGDIVKCKNPKNSLAEFEVTEISDDAKNIKVKESSFSYPADEYILVSPIIKSPIQIVSSKVFVPGIYDRVHVCGLHLKNSVKLGLHCNAVELNIRRIYEPDNYFSRILNSQELRNAAKTFIELADYLDEKEGK